MFHTQGERCYHEQKGKEMERSTVNYQPGDRPSPGGNWSLGTTDGMLSERLSQARTKSNIRNSYSRTEEVQRAERGRFYLCNTYIFGFQRDYDNKFTYSRDILN